MTIADDAIDPRGLPKAFDFEGTPKRRVELVERGVARGVRVGPRHRGARRRREHGPRAARRASGSTARGPSALAVAPGEAGSVDELLEAVDDGIYVTRLHYLSVVDPREGLITGMTRDGTFRVRGGRLAEPLVNLRFTASVPDLLADVPALTRDLTLVNRSDFYGERYPVGVVCPALATAAFNVTGTGSAPGL